MGAAWSGRRTAPRAACRIMPAKGYVRHAPWPFGCHAHGFAWACLTSIRMPTQSRGHGTLTSGYAPSIRILTLAGAKQGEAAMNAEQLRALQGPVKNRYKSDPASAMVTLRS